jgi:hypothetical protein
VSDPQLCQIRISIDIGIQDMPIRIRLIPDPHPDPLVTRTDPEADPAPELAWDPYLSHKSVDVYNFLSTSEF